MTSKSILSIMNKHKKVVADYSTKIKVLAKLVMEERGIKYGDTTTINGYTYKGRKMLVNGCHLKKDSFNNSILLVLTGWVLKKDGTPSVNSATSRFEVK